MAYRKFSSLPDWRAAVEAAGLAVVSAEFRPSEGNYEEYALFAQKPLTGEEMMKKLLLERQPRFGVYSFYPVDENGDTIPDPAGILFDDEEEFKDWWESQEE